MEQVVNPPLRPLLPFPALLTLLPGLVAAAVLPVGPGQRYATVAAAARNASPGDTVRVEPGVYPGGEYLENIQGAAKARIVFQAAPGGEVIFRGSAQAWHVTEGAHLTVAGFTFEGQTANGFNMDDGGSFDTPTHDILFEDCTFRDIAATGNNDLLKLSGVDSLVIRGCRFEGGSPGGSGIDMVGCHQVVIEDNRFLDMGSNAIQAKGGTRYLRVERNRIENAGERALNLGGSTGLSFFRPPDAPFEGADMQVYSNVFIGSQAPIAFVGVVRAEVINNTIYRPGRWVVRILQENVDPGRFLACGDNSFRNNIIHYGAVSAEVNVGPDTRPETFTFSHNLWYHEPNPARTPSLPAPDANAVMGRNPGFKDAASGDFTLTAGSPAIGAALSAARPERDFLGRAFASPRSIGAMEGNLSGSSLLFHRSAHPGSRRGLRWALLPGMAAAPLLLTGEGWVLPDGRRPGPWPE